MELTLESALSPGGMVGNLTYILLIISMAMRDIFWLRVFAIFSGLAGILYAVIWLHDPVGTFWESLFMAVNLLQWAWLVYEKKRATLTSEQAAMRDRVFPVLSNREFLKILAIAERQEFARDEHLIEQGNEVVRLYLVEQGEAAVMLDDKQVSGCQSGDFIGEIGFFNRVPATATVVAANSLQCLAFNCETLHRVMDANPGLERGVTFAMNANLASKLIRNNDTGLSV
jgi:CRP-like cAMP-binding protein